MVDPISALSAGSSVVSAVGGLFGKKKKTQAQPVQRSGYQSLNDIPFFRQNKTVDQVLPRLYEEALETDYFARPTRQLTQNEMNDPIFAPRAVMEFKNYFDDQAANAAVNPEAGMDLREIGRSYVDSYGSSGEVNPTYWKNLMSKSNFDYEDIARKLMEIQRNSSSFGQNEAMLRQMGLGYMPKALPQGVSMPTNGIPM